MSLEFGTDPPQGRWYILEVAECYAEGGGTSFRLGGTLPRNLLARRELLLAVIEACSAELVATHDPGRIDSRDPAHPWHPQHRPA